MRYPSKTTRSVATAGLIAAVSCVGLAATAAPAMATPEPSSAAATTFAYVGKPQTYVVPAGVHHLEITSEGASGGAGTDPMSANPIPGGTGAIVKTELSVKPGQVLTIDVGGAGLSGSKAGGWNGGGDAGQNTPPGAATTFASSGGGRSDITNAKGVALVVAGGGGGAGQAEGFTPGAGGNGSQAGDNGACATPSWHGYAGAGGLGGKAPSANGMAGGDSKQDAQQPWYPTGAGGGAGGGVNGGTGGASGGYPDESSGSAQASGGGGGGGSSAALGSGTTITNGNVGNGSIMITPEA